MKHIIPCILFITGLKESFSSAIETKLLFVQILFRHGDRAPINLYPTDPNPENFWVEGLGKLTKLGRKQHYVFGKFLRKMYRNFITTSPLEINVISSDCDRCLKSAETNVASFYSPDPKWQFDVNVNWQPISISYIPKDEDKYLEPDNSDCPRAFEEQERIVNSQQGQEFIQKHKEMFQNLSFYSGLVIENWTSALFLHDTLFIEKKYNLTIPYWAFPFWEELNLVADLSFYWSFNSHLMHRLRAGPFLQRIIEKIQKKIAHPLDDDKIQIYSAHDTTIAVVLDALNLFNMKQPPYCAALLFELHEIDTGGKALRLFYLNSSTPETEMQIPHLLILNGCTEFCPLEYFINYTKDLIPTDWDSECELHKTFIQNIKKNISVALILGIIIIFVILISLYILCKY